GCLSGVDGSAEARGRHAQAVKRDAPAGGYPNRPNRGAEGNERDIWSIAHSTGRRHNTEPRAPMLTCRQSSRLFAAHERSPFLTFFPRSKRTLASGPRAVRYLAQSRSPSSGCLTCSSRRRSRARSQSGPSAASSKLSTILRLLVSSASTDE